jgi:hypothetical protein
MHGLTEFSVIEAGRWDYDALCAWEKRHCERMAPALEEAVLGGGPQDLDTQMRGWLLIHLHDIVMRTARGDVATLDEVHLKNNSLFWPRDWSQATPYNCFWLRFPDSSPLMPWRRYQTMTMILEHCRVKRLNMFLLILF